MAGFLAGFTWNLHMHPPPWMAIAHAEQGVRALGAGESNPRITAYHAGTNIEGYDDKVSWCSSFVHWTLAQLGIPGTASALARSWLEWGQGLDAPVVGCITVLWRDDPESWKGHVGFFQKMEGDRIFLLGGNQQGEVRVHAYPASSVLAYRWPACSHGAFTMP
jgi:uncharacterized protein (TIGR02594 family)